VDPPAIGASATGRLALGAVASLALGLSSCSSANDAPGADGAAPTPSSAVIGCANDPRADAYQPNLTKQGASKALTFVLVSSSPAPPQINDNTWTIQVLGATGVSVSNATFSSIKTWMPDHGHGSPETPIATPNADGTYSVAPLDLFMNGLWQITFTAQVGTVSDAATFSFCIGG
jgi:hypothetical protein